jgi:hypothetical protein
MNDAEATKAEADASVGAVASTGDSAIEGGKAAIEAAESADKAAAQVGKSTDCGDKCGPLGPCMSLFGDMFQILTAPVAGPTWVWYLYILVVLGTFTFFIVNLGLLTAEWSNSSVTEVNLKWEKELAYPDIYMCLPAAVYHHAFKCCGYDCTASSSGGSDPYSKCGSWGFLGLARSASDPNPTAGCQSFGKFNDFSRHYRAESCPYTTHVGANFPSQRNYYLETPDFIQGLRPKIDTSAGVAYGQFPTHAWATALENALPTFTPQADSTFGGSNVGGGMTGTVVKSVCYYFQVTDAANAKAVYGTQSYLQNMFVATMTDALMRELPHLKIYLMPQGKQPTDSTGVIATEVTWPALAMKTIGDITVDKYKDETKGETEWTYLYNMGLSSQPVTGQLVASMSPAMTAVVNTGPSPPTFGSQYTDSGTGENKVFGMIEEFKYRFDDPLDIDLTTLVNSGGATVNSNSKCFYSGGDAKPTAEKSPANSGLFGTNLVGAFNALTISNFVVREITIRNRTVSEYWSAIGGLFAGSLLILSIFFAASGVTHNNRIVQTFNFMGKEEQEQWLEPYQPEDKLAELEKKVEALTASLNK